MSTNNVYAVPAFIQTDILLDTSDYAKSYLQTDLNWATSLAVHQLVAVTMNNEKHTLQNPSDATLLGLFYGFLEAFLSKEASSRSREKARITIRIIEAQSIQVQCDLYSEATERKPEEKTGTALATIMLADLLVMYMGALHAAKKEQQNNS